MRARPTRTRREGALAGGLVRGRPGRRRVRLTAGARGVSAETVGSRALWLGSVTLPPGGGRTKAHLHENHESALYMVSGAEIEGDTGEGLEHRGGAHAGG